MEELKTFELTTEAVNIIAEALSDKIRMWNGHNEVLMMHGVDDVVQKYVDKNNEKIAKAKNLLDYLQSQDIAPIPDKYEQIEVNGATYVLGFEDWDEITSFANGREIVILKQIDTNISVAHEYLTEEMPDEDVLEVGVWTEVSDLLDTMEDSIHINMLKDNGHDLAQTLRYFADDFEKMADLKENEMYTFDYGIVRKEGMSYISDEFFTYWYYAVKV
jgi:hypothetical protein